MLANTFDLLYDTVVHPRQAFALITRRPFNREAILAFFLLVVLSSLAGIGLVGGGAPALVGISLISAAAGMFFWAAILHLTVTLLGGDGDVRGLLRALPFSQFPQAFASFLPALLLWLPSLEMTGIVGVISALLTLWALYLQVLAISVNYRIDISRAVLAFIIPGLALFLFVVALISLVVFSFFSALFSDPTLLQQLPQDLPGMPL